MTRYGQQAVRVGDLVRVERRRGKPSEARYEVTKLGEGTSCMIREWPGQPGKKMAEQPFDTSLLIVDNAGPQEFTKALNALARNVLGRK